MNVIDSPCKVISKYFSSFHVMDESLSEFQEKKTSTKGPKTKKKPSSSQAGISKLKKRPKGQKDIRTALKPTKNQLVAYTKEFHDICKQSGVDVDSEQLQLAIALSKSLQNENNIENDSSQSSLTAKERSTKIRTTLQEYGFTVPEIKITGNSRKTRKLKRNYKLLLASAEEKQQIISDKYSQVVFEVCTKSKVVDNELFDNFEKKLYFVSTSISYSEMQNNDILYVDDLIEKSKSSGNLLKDWSDIPGRPFSPQKTEPFKMNISEIACSQDELDIVLSGTLKAAKKIVKDKVKIVTDPILIEEVKCEKSKDVGSPTLGDCENSKESMQSNSGCNNSSQRLTILEAQRSCSPDMFDDEGSVLDSSRDNKSEIYSELITSIVQNNNEKIKEDTKIVPKSQVIDDFSVIPLINVDSYDVTKRRSNDFMEVTSCVQGNLVAVTVAPINKTDFLCSGNEISQLHKTNDKTKRISNDFMEVTECVTTDLNTPHKLLGGNIDLTQNFEEDKTSTIIETNENEHDIDNNMAKYDLTQRIDKKKDLTETESNVRITEVNGNKEDKGNIANIDLTQRSEENNDFIDIRDNVPITEAYVNEQDKGSIANIDLTQRSDGNNGLIEVEDNVPTIEANVNKENVGKIVNIDLTQRSDENNDLLEVECNENSNRNNYSSRRSSSEDELPFVQISGSNVANTQSDSDDTIILNDEEIYSALNNKSPTPVKINSSALITMPDFNSKNNSLRASQSFFDDFVHDHSDSMGDKASQNNEKDDEIDLTQSSDSTVDNVQEIPNYSEILDRSSLGKKDDVSIDYDDLYNDVRQSRDASNFNDSKKSVNTDTPSGKSISQSQCKISSECTYQNSRVFEFCDEELNYSLNKSRKDEAWDNFGSTSDLDCVSKEEKRRNSDDTKTSEPDSLTNHADSFLPEVDLKQDDNTVKDNAVSNLPSKTPKKDTVKTKSVVTETPNSDYIIKTVEVTPMLDYASMTSPERNKELEKYGLKPFKRKRAIQLLQHIYNQTHPLVEECLEQPSPSKKPKLSQPSPKKCSKPESSKNLGKESSNKENLYEVTKEQPDVRAIECLEEDMVFQKRAKAKIHSCRVPLHIAFHNYVSCRQRLREAILRYEPVNIDVIHKDLVSLGFRYDPKDLLKFLDKKCITVKTADNNARNKRHY